MQLTVVTKSKDIWFSTDGTTWKQATDNAQIRKLFKHTTLSFKDKIWVIGGSRQDVIGITGNVWALE